MSLPVRLLRFYQQLPKGNAAFHAQMQAAASATAAGNAAPTTPGLTTLFGESDDENDLDFEKLSRKTKEACHTLRDSLEKCKGTSGGVKKDGSLKNKSKAAICKEAKDNAQAEKIIEELGSGTRPATSVANQK